MKKVIFNLLWGIIFIGASAVRGQTPSPVPSPSPGTGEECLEFVNSFGDREKWIDCNYDPVTTRRGVDIRVKDIIVQSATANMAVRCTYGYENIYYNDGSGDIRGLYCQGFIDIVGTEVIAKWWRNIFVSQVYAASDKWKKVKAIKKLPHLQVKPKKPKKVKWKKAHGLKEKKAEFEAVAQ